MKKVEVSTQIEFDAQVAIGNTVIVRAGFFIARGSSHVIARGSSHVEARGSSHVEARESSHVEAWESSHVIAWGSSHVEAWGSSHVEARESSHVIAWANVTIKLFSAIKIKASANVIIQIFGKCKSVRGGIKINAVKTKTIKDWCEYYGAKRSKGYVILYKAVDENFTTPRGTYYTPKTKPKALDWDGGVKECGNGLHFSASPKEAKEFFRKATRFIACPIKENEITIHPNGDYPQKVKARAVSKPCYEVDIDGNRIK